MGSDPTVIGKYFDLLEHTLSDNHLLDKPSQIFNLDETGMPVNPSQPRIVATRGMKNPNCRVFRRQVVNPCPCLLQCISLCSSSFRHLRPKLKQDFSVGEVPGTVYCLSKKGWIGGELFEMWFVRHFLAHAPPVRLILLLMDGYSSHYQPAAIRRAGEEGVIMLLLPPHMSHLTQPLDKG